MTSFSQKRAPKARKHWTQKAHESTVRRDGNNQFHLEIEGGASQGLFPIIISAEQSKIHYESGKVLPGELLLEVNNKRVAGMTARDVTALMRRATDPVYLKTVKQNSTITKDLKLYLGTRFQKDSIDYEVQECIRKNLYQRTTPCTTRPRRDGEKHGRDYYFLTKEQFKMMEDRGDLLESGVFDGHLYGTPKPPEDPDDGPISNIIGTPAREKPQIVPPNKLAPNMACSPGHRALRRQANLLKNLGPLPQNWEIDYTNTGDKYFIDHNTGSTHWLDPRLRRVMKMNPLHCEDDELPFGWQVIDDPNVGLYYVDHINRRTQFENPVLQARMGQTPGQAQYNPMQSLPVGPYPMEMQYPPPFMQGQYPPQSNSPPRPMRMPPPVPGQQQQQQMPGMWPEGWTPELVLSRIEGEIVVTQLKNSGSGFGFVLIGGDSPGELLVIKDIMQYSAAEKDGVLMKGDVLVRVNSQIILMCQHQDVVQLIKSVQIGDVVEIEVRRNAIYPPLRGFPLFDSAPPPEEFPYENISIQIERGSYGFGFTITDGNNGQAIKSINDAERCLKLRVGDLLVNINGKDVLNMNHQKVVSVLKSCPTGAVCNFIVRRDMPQEVAMQHKESHRIQYEETFASKNGDHDDVSPSPPPVPLHDYETVEFLLHAGESGFGFAIVGGANDGLPVSVGRIIPGGPAHQDGRLQIGDEITHVNGQSLYGATHQDVISLISNSSINRSIMLRILRQRDVGMLTDPSQLFTGPRVVTLEKQQEESFGFVIQSNGMEGSIISRLLEDSPAMRCRQLHLGDMIIQVNGEDVRGMSHHDVVSRIKASSQKIALTVQEMGLEDQLEGAPDPQSQFQPPSPTQSHRYAVTQNPQQQQQQQEIPRLPFPGGDDEEYNPQQLDEEEVFVIEIQKDGEGFGFSIHGGSDVGFALRVMKIAPGKAADRDGRLLANDEILEINGQETQNMMHHEVIDQIKHGGDRVKLIIRRGIDFGQELKNQ